jgi:Ala-tRNA(Pro) deacylase
MTPTAPLEMLEHAQVRFELIPHRRTETATAEAHELGVPADDVAKTLVVVTPEGCVRTLVPASRRLDLRKLRETIGLHGPLRLATEAELARDYPEFELGAVPPLGGARRDAVLVDSRLAAHDELVFELGTHDESVRLRTEDLLTVTTGRVADLCQD